MWTWYLLRLMDGLFGPYDGQVNDGLIYGRGTVDDKGPLIATLYAGLALKKCGYPMTKTIRYMFGCDEENQFACINHYLKHRKAAGNRLYAGWLLSAGNR